MAGYLDTFASTRKRAAAAKLRQKAAEEDLANQGKVNPLGWLEPVLAAAGGVVGAVYGGPAGASAGAAAGGALGGGVASLTGPEKEDKASKAATSGATDLIETTADIASGWDKVLNTFHKARGAGGQG